MTGKFRIAHLLLHKLSVSQDESLMTNATGFAAGPRAREAFENGLAAQQRNWMTLTRKVTTQPRNFAKLCQPIQHLTGLTHDSSLPTDTRHTEQFELARNNQLRHQFPFLDFVLDEENWARKLDALQSLPWLGQFYKAKSPEEEADRLTMRQGLDKIINLVTKKGLL